MHTVWYVNDGLTETLGRITVHEDELVLSSLNRADNNLTITCEVSEDMGMTSRGSTTIHVTWGPGPGPVLNLNRL